jgi:hypothetical protein
MNVIEALAESPIGAAIKQVDGPALIAVRAGHDSSDPIDRYLQHPGTREYDRMAVTYPLNGLRGDEEPDAWTPLQEWPIGFTPES